MLGLYRRTSRFCPRGTPCGFAPAQVYIQAGLREVPAQDVAPEQPGQIRADLVFDEVALAHGEDKVEIFEGQALGLFHEQEDEDEGDKVEAREEA